MNFKHVILFCFCDELFFKYGSMMYFDSAMAFKACMCLILHLLICFREDWSMHMWLTLIIVVVIGICVCTPFSVPFM